MSQKSTADAVTLSAGKRRSSVSDAGLLSVSGSFLDCTASPDRHDTPGKLNAGAIYKFQNFIMIVC